MQVLHGEIGDVSGQMHTHGDFGFICADVSLSGESWMLESGLRDFPELEGLSAIQPLVENQIDAIWVIGRLKAVFGSWLALEEGEKSILNQGFVAYHKSRDISLPFIVCDYYLRTAMMFGATLTDEELKGAIARSFYEMLLAAPTELVAFSFRKEHIGAGITMVGGIVNGQVQYDEEP